MTKRRRISTRDRAKLFAAHKGVCHLCGTRIQPGEAWGVSHPIPLECGGADDETNWAPAHAKCHKRQTAEIDIPLIAKLKRIEANHIGASRPAGTIKSRGFDKAPRAPKRLSDAKRCAGPSALARQIQPIGE